MLAIAIISYMENKRKQMTTQVQLAARIDEKVKAAVQALCTSRGLIMSRFIEDALIDKLEEIEDVEDLREIQKESSRRFSELLAELKLDGKKVRH